MRRREFFVQASYAALEFSLLPLAGCAHRASRSAPTAARVNARLTSLVADLELEIPNWMRDASVPGIGICIIAGAKVAWRRGFGVKDVASNAPIDNDTMFEAASMSKPVFAYVVMKLCEAGVMNLDTPLTRYTSERFLEGDARLELITARHVLSHTGGFQNWRSDEKPLAIHFAPGERYEYSGEGYNYLQTVVTRLLGQPFETYMRARLLEPFAMASSGYVWQDAFGPHMARPHDPSGKPIKLKQSTAADVARYGSAGALLTTPTDYARFMIEVIDPKPSDAFRLRSLSVREMLRPHVKLDGGPYKTSWALGWQLFHNKDGNFIYHGGDNEGFHCAAVASVATKSGFVAMTNGDNGTVVLKNLIMNAAVQDFFAG